MKLGELTIEATKIIRDTFHECDETWRMYAVIRPARSFVPSRSINTYAKLLTIPAEEIDSGEWKKRLVVMARSAALKFNEVFWHQVAEAGGPESDHSTSPSMTIEHLDEQMQSIEVEVAFLLGEQYPCITTAVTQQDGSVELRVFYDFGVAARALEPAA